MLTDVERAWLLTAALNRQLWRDYREQVELVRERADLRIAAQLARTREGDQ